TGRVFQLGDKVQIEVWRANLVKKQLDFRMPGVEEASESLSQRSHGESNSWGRSGGGKESAGRSSGSRNTGSRNTGSRASGSGSSGKSASGGRSSSGRSSNGRGGNRSKNRNR
ncbi:MAG: hypothetical protein AB7C90_07625, partial [Bacteroidales bacterium]